MKTTTLKLYRSNWLNDLKLSSKLRAPRASPAQLLQSSSPCGVYGRSDVSGLGVSFRPEAAPALEAGL